MRPSPRCNGLGYDAFSLGEVNGKRVPSHLLIVGGGYVGREFAQVMKRFGSQVTVIESGPQLLSREDQDTAEALLELFRDDGIEVLLRAQVRKVSGANLVTHATIADTRG